MATPNQIAANQANSQKSTGPKTEAGKAASSRNRLSHGFASSIKVIAGENAEEFKALHNDLTLEYQPATATEQILVEKMAVQQWLSLRAVRLQSEIFLARDLRQEPFGIPHQLGLLIRYQTAAERAFHRAHNELLKAQKERKKSEIGFVPQPPAKPAAPEADLPIEHTSPLPFPAQHEGKILPDVAKFMTGAA